MFTIHGQSPNLQGQLMNEERLENIETKIAYQEDLIEELNSKKSWSDLKQLVYRSPVTSHRCMNHRMRANSR
jgi:hypothetical protein